MNPQLQQVLTEIDSPEERLLLGQTLCYHQQLSSTEQIQVIEHITVNLQEVVITTQPRKSKSWRDLAGIAPNLLSGEDAQAWVNRERNEWSQREE
jgi:reverse gyrase